MSAIAEFLVAIPALIALGFTTGFPFILVHLLLLRLTARWRRVTQWIVPIFVLVFLAQPLVIALHRSMTGSTLSFHTPWQIYLVALVVWEGMLALMTAGMNCADAEHEKRAGREQGS